MYQEAIRIGTLVPGRQDTAAYIKQILDHGFESFSITFWKTVGDTDLARLANDVNDTLAGYDIRISSLGVFGNPLELHNEAEETRASWRKLIDAAPLFDCDIVAGFAGRLIDKPIPESVPRFKEVFGSLAQRAADKGVRLAFENCEMGGSWERGDWNIAQIPAAWELMFDAVPADNIGLEWEPAHQLEKLIDPMPQLRKWVKKIFHLHGKDATIHWDVIREHGVKGGKQYAYHRTPGFGDSNWTDIISELRQGGFTGSIDIEGWHDPVYRGDLEMMGQVHGLNYLKQCRGGAYAPNPV
ncbi:MAG: sugar phosphate isomerase/epimerase [Candidatus Hydrogenedentes bacterium]|nr:sugar phosphate isomerase/epimerase [Candidatus Hydrogenedentota bacterium]